MVAGQGLSGLRRLKGQSQTCNGGRGFVREALGQTRGMRENRQLTLVSAQMDVANRSTRDEISSIFEEVLGHPVQIEDDTDIVEDLGMDSLAVMNFVMAVEDFYD